MRQVIVLEHITLDGVIQAPGGPEEDTSDGFTHGGWITPYADAILGAALRKQMNKPFDLLLGRRTYDIWAPYWPHNGDIWPGANAATKYVASNTITSGAWQPFVLLAGDIATQIAEIKQQQGPDLHVWGSGDLVQTLLKHDLIDTFWLMIYPITLGEGKRLFAGGTIPAAFKVTEGTVTPSGVIVVNYARAGAITTAPLHSQQFFHGTRGDLKPGDLIEPDPPADDGALDEMSSAVALTPSLDAAIWAAELAAGEGPGRVYIVEPTGPIENAPEPERQGAPLGLTMTHRTREPLRVIDEVTEWRYYHGTRADLKPGDLIRAGHAPNFGNLDRTTTYVYLTRTLDAATWGAELALGDGPGRIYIVEPTGPIEEDPNLTNQRFRGNPTKSFRSREPLRVTGEVMEWQGHAPETVKAMQDGLARLAQQGVEPMDD